MPDTFDLIWYPPDEESDTGGSLTVDLTSLDSLTTLAVRVSGTGLDVEVE